MYPCPSVPNRLANVSLEISPKPFVHTDDESVRAVLREVFRHWYSLLKHADSVSLLWWLSDGTDILTYAFDLDAEVEWMYWQGFAHETYKVPPEKDPEGESIVGHPRVYRADAPRITGRDVRRIVALMKATGREVLGRDIRVGAAFDPGAEFSNHPFRYRDHPELLLGETIKCIDCTGRLHADGARYAGFPEGIPEGTPFGTFFGRQCWHYLGDMGFDYLWLSNSFGFGRSPYAFGGAGQFFDGERYRPEGNTAVRDAVLEFWQLFRRECPGIPVECRGTDFTVGMNLVNHATPYAAMYAGDFGFTPPPNTPWPALTRNHGLALAGYMTQICAYPGDRFPFRFYATDPWWCNSPWMDRWERRPHDIYLSTAVTRTDATGAVRAFNDVKFLSIDTAWGELPEMIPDEIIPHVKRALAFRPDGIPPVLWVYPFREYHSHTFDCPDRMDEVMFGDLFIQQALNAGLPLSGIITTDAYVSAAAASPGRFAGSVLLSVVPDPGTPWEETLLAHRAAGGSILCYGPAEHASARFLDVLNLTCGSPLEGELTLQTDDPDTYTHTPPAGTCRHHPALSAGGATESMANPADPATRVRATLTNGAGERVAALSRGSAGGSGGRIAWVRGTSSVTVAGIRGRNLAVHDPVEAYPCEVLLRHALGDLGWQIATERCRAARDATHLTVSRCRNAFVFAAYSPDPTVVFRIRTPPGAPILPGRTTRIERGAAVVPVHDWFHEECRLFVEQADGDVHLHAVSPKHYRYRRRWALSGLNRATVRFFPETGCDACTDVLLNPDFNYFAVGEACEGTRIDGPCGRLLEFRDVTGTLTVAWSPDAAVVPVLPGNAHHVGQPG